MRVLVTGSSGFVGGAIAVHLLERGWQVLGLSRTRGRLPAAAEFVAADLGSDSLAARVDTLPRCDGIVHAAASLDKEPCAPALSLVNGWGTQQALQLAERWRVASFVFISSLPVIGMPCILPITEEHPVRPLTAYHASKLYGEHLTKMAGRTGMHAAILRLTAPVGIGMQPSRILPTFVRCALAGEPIELAGRGLRRQNYVDVRDVAQAVEQSLRRGAEGIFNIAGRDTVSNLELARACLRVLESACPVRFSSRPDPEDGICWDVAIGKAAAHLSYEPRYHVEDTIRWLASRRSSAGLEGELSQACQI